MGAQSKHAPLPPWGYAVAGATGAVLANAVVYPLDIVKTKLQVQVKKRPATTADEKKPNGTSNGTTSNGITINGSTSAGEHEEEHEHYDSTLDAIFKIVAKAGIPGLYSGIAGSLLGVASTNFAYFYWYTFVRNWYLRRVGNPSSLNTATELLLGAVAGALAQLFTIPVAVVTTRQQTRPLNAPHVGLLDTAREVIAEDGASGLWRGLKASLVLVVNPAITYGSYQKFKEILYPNKTRLSAFESFLLGALSKAVATCATQPLIVAKVGLQSRPPPARKGKPFKSFIEVMRFIVEHEGALGLFKGIGPQIMKGLIVQGMLMMTKEKLELSFVLIFAGIRKMRQRQLAEKAALLVKNTIEKV
ncbi:mitochondrial carrier [Wilcoxina mikolae CBS 423.85]|nr:mitochondrial carrier [Wilcoxina mikolae CBS 423.85]